MRWIQSTLSLLAYCSLGFVVAEIYLTLNKLWTRKHEPQVVESISPMSKLVGLIPMKLWAEWAKKWGVNANDTAAMRDVVAREMNNSDNVHLRVWEGRY